VHIQNKIQCLHTISSRRLISQLRKSKKKFREKCCVITLKNSFIQTETVKNKHKKKHARTHTHTHIKLQAKEVNLMEQQQKKTHTERKTKNPKQNNGTVKWGRALQSTNMSTVELSILVYRRATKIFEVSPVAALFPAISLRISVALSCLLSLHLDWSVDRR